MSRRATSIAILAALAGTLVPATALATSAGDGGFTVTGRTIPQAGAPNGAKGVPSLYGARIALCNRSPLIDARAAFVTTRIRPIAGATHVAVKLDLYERSLPGGHWTLRGDVPGLGTWTSPTDPSIGSRPNDVWRYRQAVSRLLVPYAYRFEAGFRWLDDSGAIVREETTTTNICRQPDIRPELTIADVVPRASAQSPGVVRYRVILRNDGRSRARAVVVAGTLPGDTVAGTRIVHVGRVEAGATVSVLFSGPGCASAAEGPSPVFTADPANAIEEQDELDNTFTLSCPVP